MSASITDPQKLFDRWFDQAFDVLRVFDDGDGATAGMMMALPLFGRYIEVLKLRNPSKGFYEIMAAELDLPGKKEAKIFWTVFRHGICHTGMPYSEGDKLGPLPPPEISGSYSAKPEFKKGHMGVDSICIDTWKFIDMVAGIYRREPSLLTALPNAPLLGIHVV